MKYFLKTYWYSLAYYDAQRKHFFRLFKWSFPKYLCIFV